MKYYSIGEFSTLIGKTPQKLRDWNKKRYIHATAHNRWWHKILLTRTT